MSDKHIFSLSTLLPVLNSKQNVFKNKKKTRPTDFHLVAFNKLAHAVVFVSDEREHDENWKKEESDHCLPQLNLNIYLVEYKTVI